MEWVEVKGPTIEVAVAAALEELGLASADEADVEVIQEPEKGFLGVGRREAVVRVKTKPKQSRRRRRGRGGRGRGRDDQNADTDRGKADRGGQAKGRPPQKKRPAGDGRSSGSGPGSSKSRNAGATSSRSGGKNGDMDRQEPTLTAEEREQVVREFLSGVLTAFDLDGSVEVSTDDDVLVADIVGEQTEALVGHKGSIRSALHDLTRTVVQRKTQESVRLRLDVAGYNARRREALGIYTQRLVDQLREEGGGEVMLEPMNAADRKVIHDAIADIDGASSFSEGEEPRRSVVISVVVDDEG